MARRVVVLAGIVVIVALLFLFFVPVVNVGPNPRIGYWGCPANGVCHWPVYDSVTYRAFNVGGVLMDTGYAVIL
jgi:hypothetical protein